MAARIEWAPDDSTLVSCIGGAVRIHDPRVPSRAREVAERVLDARYLDDGRILAIDDRGWQRWTATGELVGQRHASDPRRATSAALAAGGTRYVAMRQLGGRTARVEIFIKSVDGERLWTLNAAAHDLHVYERASAQLSGDGAVVAIGYRMQSAPPRRHEFVVIDVANDIVLDRGSARMAEATSELSIDLDATGDRFALAGSSESLGVIRTGRGDSYLRHDASGAVAVALDRGGNLAAFAFAFVPDGARGRVRVDYLSHDADGPPTVAVIDTLTIEPALHNVIAVAFSRDSRDLACLASDGTIEVVPVP
jgi:hypothetical protein